jgi:hypothetical protein
VSEQTPDRSDRGASNAGTGDATAGEIQTLSRLTVDSFSDLRPALAELAAVRAAALERGEDINAAVLAALAAQWIVSDFGSLTQLAPWAEHLVSTPVVLEQLDDHAALIYCAGILALHQTQHGTGLPDATLCLEHFRDRLFANHRRLDHNLAVATAEHPASWLANAGQATALEELAALVDGLLGDARLDHRIRARWLLWMGANQMHSDRREAAERTWAEAQNSPQSTAWPWLRFQLARMAVRPLVEDGRYDEASQQLVALRSWLDYDRPLDLADYHHLSGWIALSTGDSRVGREHYELALVAARRGALPPNMRQVYEVGLTQALIAEGREDDAIAALATFHALPGPRGDTLRAATIALARACKAQRSASADYATRLRDAMQLLREQGLLRFLRLVPRLAAQLAADALEADIEPAFIHQVIAARRLKPPASAALSDAWPWPIQVHALRPFAVTIAGKPLESGTRAQLKPLAMLKFLACVEGGPVAVTRVLDALWAQEDPAAARRVFDVTVGRLRQLLGTAAAVEVSQGRIELDPTVVWLDTRALAEVARSAAPPASIARRALALYRAPLLASEEEEGWVLAARGRASKWFVAAIERAVQGLVAAGAADDARACVNQAALVDDSERLQRLAEELAHR